MTRLVLLLALVATACGPLPAHMGGRERTRSHRHEARPQEAPPAAPQEQPAKDPSGRTVRRSDPNEKPRPSAQRKAACEEMLPLVQRIAPNYGLPPLLVLGLIKVESGFNPRIVSRAGAKGLMQVMPRTAQHMKCDGDLFDPATNIDCGCRVLQTYLKRYDGDVIFGLAAYNAGPGNVNMAAKNKLSPFNLSYPERVLRWQKLFEENGCM
jgi:soluble lytic murein transglycosylase-like protein